MLIINFTHSLSRNDHKKFKLLLDKNKEIGINLLSHMYIWINSTKKEKFFDTLHLCIKNSSSIKHWSDMSQEKVEEAWAPIIGMLLNYPKSPFFLIPKITYEKQKTTTLLNKTISLYGEKSPITKELINTILKKHNLKH